MEEKRSKNWWIIGLNIILILISLGFIYAYLHNDLSTGHDSFYVHQYITSVDYFCSTGRLISRILCAIFYHTIPNTLHVHPNDIASTIVPLCTGLFISIMTIFCYKILTFFSTPKINILEQKTFSFLYLPIFTTIALIPISKIGDEAYFFSSIAESVRYYDGIFNFIFILIFIYAILDLIFKEKTKKLRYTLYFINSLCIGVCYEMITAIAILFSIPTFFYSLFLYKKKELKKENFLQIIGLIFGLGISTLFFLFKTEYHSFEISQYNASISLSPIEILNNIQHFFPQFFNVAIKENCILLCILAFLMITFFFKRKSDKNISKITTLSIFVLLSCIFYFIGLAIAGKCEVYSFEYWGEYYPFKAIYFKILYTILLLNIGLLLNKIELNKLCRIILITIIGLGLYFIPIKDYKNIKNEFTYQIKLMDKLEKTKLTADAYSDLYNKLDGIIILPISFYEKYSQHTSTFRPVCHDSRESIRNAMVEISKKEIAQGKTRLFTFKFDDDFYFENDYLDYLKTIYKIRADGIIFVRDDIAKQEYEKRNYINQKIKNLNFTKILKSTKRKLTLEQINNLIKEDNSQEYLYMTRCRYYLQEKNYTKALLDCSKAIELQKNNEFLNHYYWQRAQIAYKIENYELAKKDLLELLKKTESFEARKMLADIYAKEKNFEEAIKIYLELLEIFPYSAIDLGDPKTYHSDIASLHLQNKNYKEAIRYTRMSQEIDEESTIYLYSAEANIELGNFEEAKKDIELGYRYNPDFNAQYNELKEIIENKK